MPDGTTQAVGWPVTVGAPIDYLIAEYAQSEKSDKSKKRALPARWRDVIVGLLLVSAVATLAQMARKTDPVSNVEWELYSRFSKARDMSKRYNESFLPPR